ncbi:hypothetical protein NV379_14325 [Paenibacillus sp. N1-5-1-14]|nr:hypothetical protein [Paenibacillus radicibacter]MCR8643828.1 hypothetical protein [Paenibacillus radicibacter]
MSGEKTVSWEYVSQAMLLVVLVIVFFVGMLLWTKWQKRKGRK